jgi:NTP pyrophosphatase (non-canonical NTP hydrolase)
MKISEAQRQMKEILGAHKIRKSPLASVVGVYEELGELSSAILQKEGFKKREKQADIGYVLAEVFAELLKLTEDLDIDLEKEFSQALELWKESKPLWK